MPSHHTATPHSRKVRFFSDAREYPEDLKPPLKTEKEDPLKGYYSGKIYEIEYEDEEKIEKQMQMAKVIALADMHRKIARMNIHSVHDCIRDIVKTIEKRIIHLSQFSKMRPFIELCNRFLAIGIASSESRELRIQRDVFILRIRGLPKDVAEEKLLKFDSKISKYPHALAPIEKFLDMEDLKDCLSEFRAQYELHLAYHTKLKFHRNHKSNSIKLLEEIEDIAFRYEEQSQTFNKHLERVYLK